MAELPDAALSTLGLIIKQAVATLTIPAQDLLNVLCLLGKTSGGSRTIALMSSIYRIMMKMAGEEIREWDAAYSHHWDSAIAGFSSLRAAVLRALLCENGAARGEQVAHMLWDKKKFYDNVTLPLLAEELDRRNYPKHLFVLGFFAHAAPRVLQVGKCLG